MAILIFDKFKCVTILSQFLDAHFPIRQDQSIEEESWFVFQ